MVIAWLLAYWFSSKATNLSYYGINTQLVLSKVKKDITKTETNQEVEERLYQDKLRHLINEIYEELKNESDPYVSLKLERELTEVSRYIQLREGEVFSIDQLINNLKEEKRMSKRFNY
jgi:hypothetical protein